MMWERILYAFWPAATLLLFTTAFYLWGGVWVLAPLAVVIGAMLVFAWLVLLLISGFKMMKLPTSHQIYRRLDQSVEGTPVSSLMDELALGHKDAGSQELWHAHLQRMARKAAHVEVPQGYVRLAGTDNYALRLVGILAVVTGLMFSNGTPSDDATSLNGVIDGLNVGPSFEAWAKPPLYTGLPTVYLNDVDEGEPISLAEGSEFLIRAYGEVGELSIVENLSVTGNTQFPATQDVLAEVQFFMTQSGTLSLESLNGPVRSWDISLLSDLPPMIEITGELTRDLQGAMQLPFRASDDYGVTSGALGITLDIENVDRRYGLALEPEPKAELTGELPLPFNANASDFEGVVEEDFAKHVWAGLPVTVELSATDAGGNTGNIKPLQAELARKRFFDPLSAALVDVRRQLLWSRNNAERGIYLLRAVTHKPDSSFSRNKAYEMTREAIRGLETYGDVALSDQTQSEVSELLWAAAILIEDGDVNDAKERLRRAQERLAEAMENGATPEEIDELMEELRQATKDYIKELGDNAEETDGPSGNQQSEAVSDDEIQEMMDEIQRLMDEGRMDEAMELLQELQELLENLEVTKQSGQSGEGDPQEQDMQDMLEEQQELADETFQELQEQFQQQQDEQQKGEQQQDQDGQQDGQSGQQEGQQPGEEQGQSGIQQGDQEGGSQGGEQQVEGQQQGQGEQGESGQGQAGTGSSDLAGRQKTLRDMLDQQRGNLPNDGSGAGEAARDALNDADREMGAAEESLREGDFGQALDQQSDALQSLRRGMRAMKEDGRQAQNGSEGETQDGGNSQTAGRDPLGRPNGGNQSGSTVDDTARNEGLNNAGRRKAYEDLLNDLKGRAQDRTRPEFELDYLGRLLDRF
jgi:uncharacterized protein (TIGR02302 family)